MANKKTPILSVPEFANIFCFDSFGLNRVSLFIFSPILRDWPERKYCRRDP